MTSEGIGKEALFSGLSAQEVEASRSRHGANVLTPPKRASLWKLYLDKYRDPIIRILLVAALVSMVLAFIENDFIETIGIIAAIFLATTIGFYFERDAMKKFSVLVQINEEQPVKVRREGHVTSVPRRDVVVGDLIIVETGDEIPADARLIKVRNLQVNESSLTGEPLVTKHLSDDTSTSDLSKKSEEAYPSDLILRSTMVMSGHAEAIVTAVGDQTEIGKVARLSTELTSTVTPLNQQLDRLAGLISKIGSGVSIAAFLIFLLHDIFTSPLWHTNDYLGMAHEVLKYFMMAVTLIVMAVPEGLPMAVTLSLALNMRRMLRSNILVRKLHASETMGAVTVICTDKTGTLTQNQMQVAEMFLCPSADEEVKNRFFEAIAANTTAELDGEKVIGNPSEGALLLWLRNQQQDYTTLRSSVNIVEQIPFSTERKMMATVVVDDDNRPWVYLKGAPEKVLALCEMDDTEREALRCQLLTYQQQAMRTLALAARPDTTNDILTSGNYRLQALVAISDPIRQDVPDAISHCRAAGIQVKVVTGDTAPTAIEIAKRIGLWLPEDTTNTEGWGMTGDAWAALTDDEASKAARSLRVLSRARPADKQRLVRLLQQQGEVVAVTGDGTNDAPALNHAHVGLSLGSGTSVAKEASDITLIDDSFGSIVNAVMWGRSLYKNIQRFLFFQLVVNLTALLLVLAGSFVGTEMPLTVTQILWVNLIMDTFAALALASLPPSSGCLNEPPRRQDSFIISGGMARGIITWGLLFFAGMFVFLLWCERSGSGSVLSVRELTWFFTTFVMLQFWNLLNAKCIGSHHSAFRRLRADRGLLLVMLLIVLGQWLIVTFGGAMFRVQPLSAKEWAIIIVATAPVLVIGELWRWINRLKSA